MVSEPIKKEHTITSKSGEKFKFAFEHDPEDNTVHMNVYPIHDDEPLKAQKAVYGAEGLLSKGVLKINDVQYFDPFYLNGGLGKAIFIFTRIMVGDKIKRIKMTDVDNPFLEESLEKRVGPKKDEEFFEMESKNVPKLNLVSDIIGSFEDRIQKTSKLIRKSMAKSKTETIGINAKTAKEILKKHQENLEKVKRGEKLNQEDLPKIEDFGFNELIKRKCLANLRKINPLYGIYGRHPFDAAHAIVKHLKGELGAKK